jgi:hypothetical protein
MWFGPPEHNTLCPQSVCNVVQVWGRTYLKEHCLNLLSARFFYSSRSGSYIVTQGPIGGPRVVESLLQQLGHLMLEVG